MPVYTQEPYVVTVETPAAPAPPSIANLGAEDRWRLQQAAENGRSMTESNKKLMIVSISIGAGIVLLLVIVLMYMMATNARKH